MEQRTVERRYQPSQSALPLPIHMVSPFPSRTRVPSASSIRKHCICSSQPAKPIASLCVDIEQGALSITLVTSIWMFNQYGTTYGRAQISTESIGIASAHTYGVVVSISNPCAFSFFNLEALLLCSSQSWSQNSDKSSILGTKYAWLKCSKSGCGGFECTFDNLDQLVNNSVQLVFFTA